MSESNFKNNYAEEDSTDANGAPASEEDQGPPFDPVAYRTSLLATAPSTWKGPALTAGTKVRITADDGHVCVKTFLGFHPEGSDIGWPVFDANLYAFVRSNPKLHTFEVTTA
jgi:hypothetical protein